MARELSDIIRELDASYNPQRQSLQGQIDALPGQADAQIQGLQAQQNQAFDDILGGARSRGLGFSGIPIAEQAKYTAGTFLPAVAQVRQSQNQQRTSLTDALNNINLSQNQYAQQLRQSELDRDEQARQFNESLKAQKSQTSGLAGLFGGGAQPSAANNPASATATQRADKGFNFTDANGRPISAAQYAQYKGVPFRQLLQQLANSGDQGAKQALGYVGDDFNYNRAKVGTNAGVANLLNNLLWGVNSVQLPSKPAAKKSNPSLYAGTTNKNGSPSFLGGR